MPKRPNYKSYKTKYGLTYGKYIALRSRIMFRQRWKCDGCGEDIGLKKGDAHLHHLDENPKNNCEWNLVVVCELDHWFCHGFQSQRPKPKIVVVAKLERFD